ncbi:MAG: efflux RND transporter permease subunit [Candidatus Omnitrophica bacterium]|nr:efflux RND transporter permease subunit [Candidatus Omnitrophota bacterium]
MALPDFSVRRPVTTVMIFLGVLLLGFISWNRLPQELYPPIVYPQLTIVTFYKDAAPEEMEILVTKPVEEAVGTVSGVRRISSTSKEEISMVIAEFTWGTNMDFAALGVREKIDLIKESLPRGSEDPIVMKFNPFELPVAILNITSEGMSASDLEYTARKIIKNELEKADGVASCNISGGVTREVLVEVNQDKMMSKGIAITDIVEALNKANMNYPAGTIEEQFYEYLIRTMGEFKLVPEIRDIIIGTDDRTKKSRFQEYGQEDVKEKEVNAVQNKRLIELKDIAAIRDTFKEKTSISRYNQKESISLSIQKQAGTNTVQVANNIKEVLLQLKEQLHESVKINIVYDQSRFIKNSINGVRDAAMQGGFLAFLVLYFFLRNFRSSLIVTLNIPISIMVVFGFMYFSGITLNMISLGGLALGVGMLVDNGIVVIENIYRHRQEGKSPKEASIYGANEVYGAITGSTLTTIAVFLPMIFVIGIAGQLFKELAFTVTISLVASLAVALTLIPLLASRERHIPDVEEKKKSLGALAIVLNVLHALNDKALLIFLNHKTIALTAVFLIFLGACLLIPVLDKELLPRVDQGQFIIKIDMPPGTKLKTTDLISKKIENQLFDFNEVQDVTVNIGSAKEKKGEQLIETMGSNQGQIIINLKPKVRIGKTGPGYRMFSTAEILQKLKSLLEKQNLEGADINYVLQESFFKGAFQAGKPIVIDIKGQDLVKLKEIADNLETGLKGIDGIYGIENDLIPPSPEIKAKINKEKAANYNLTVSDIALTAQTAVKGYTATKFKEEGREIDITVRLREKDRNKMEKIRRLILHSPLGIDVPLAEVASLVKGLGPTEIRRQDQQRTVLVSASIFKKGFNEVSYLIDSMLKRLKLPPSYSAELTGERQQMQESFNSLRFALLLSVVLVYMIMAAQFESLWQPFIIMFTVPLAIIGVIAILFVTKTPVNTMVLLGIIILGGIVVNNGIVLIDYVNILRKEGLTAYDALVKASHVRLRPILMTALTTIFGLIPLALGLGEGAELQQPMAVTVIGGLSVSTFLSLIVIPAIYLSFEEVKRLLMKVFSFIFYKKPTKPMTLQLVPISSSKQEIIKKPEPKKEPKEEPKEKPEEKSEPKIEPKPEIKPEIKPAPKAKPEPEAKPEIRPELKAEPRKPEAGQGSIPQGLWDSLIARHQELIVYLRKNHKITRKEYSDIFKISVPTAARDLKFLTEKNILQFKGPAGPGRYYMLKQT